MTMAQNGTVGQGGRRGGFSLIELLVVIFIIIVIIAITIPALGVARRSAKKTETQSLLNSLGTAVVQYETDNKHVPGYFSVRDMGRVSNETRCFSAMQNMLLDLSGGVLENQTTPIGATVKDVGPVAANTVRIDTALIGATSTAGKVYFTPSRKAFIVQDGTQGSRAAATTVPEHVYPELVDAFGTPILAWVEDATAVQAVDTVNDFARQNSGPTGNVVSRFYWASNAAFLTGGVKVGKRNVDQGDVSMFGQGGASSPTPAEVASSLTGLLGNPNSAQNVSNPTTPFQDILPSAARGSVVLHSAGEDGAFMPRKQGSTPTVRDGGMAQCDPSGSDGAVYYFGLNFRALDNSALSTSTDIAKSFNDIIQASGS